MDRGGAPNKWLRLADDDEVGRCQAVLLEALSNDRELLADAAWDAIVRSAPAYGRLERPQAEGVQRSIRLVLTTLLDCLAENRPLNTRETAALNDVGYRRFRQGIPLDGLVAGFRAASETGYSLLGEHARRLPLSPSVLEAQTVISTRLVGRLHEVFGAVTAGYGETVPHHAKDRLRSEAILVEDMVEGLWSDEQALRDRANSLGYQLGRKCALFVVVPDDSDIDVSEMRHGIDLLASRLHGAIPGPTHTVPRTYGLVVVPLSGRRSERWDDALAGASEAAQAIRARVVAFGPVSGPADLAGLHREAMDGLAVLEAAAGSRRVLTPDDLWPFRALHLTSKDERGAMALVRESIGAVLALRKDRALEMLRTLVCLYEYGERKTVADALNVTTKGLQYRLGRVKEITDLDASKPRDRLRLDVSTLLYRLHASMPPPGDKAWR